MASDLEQVSVELEARVARYRTDMLDSATVTEKSLTRIENSATKMERQVGRSFSNAAQQSRNLGFQISDIGVQLSSGTSPFIVLAQQGPQVANALEGARGAVGRFATFLSGPVGAAVLAATTLVGVWLSKNKEAGESIDDLVAKLQAQARQTKLNEQANDVFSRSIEGVTKAADDAEKAVEALRLAKKGEAQQTVESIKKNLEDAAAVRAATKARLDQAIAILELERSGSETTSANSAEAIAQQRLLNQRIESVKALRKELDEADKQAARLQKSLNGAISAQTVEQENASAVEKINRKFDAEIDRAAAASNASKKSQDALRAEIALINKAREAELKREADSKRTARDTGDATRFISPVSGGTVRGQFGENRGNRNHAGIDIAVPVGTRVNAPAAGTIIEAGTLPGYGNVVYIDHGRGTISRLAHLSNIAVQKGDIVGQGDIVGLSGGARGAPGSGNSRGPHVHQELRINGRPVDPRKGPFPTDPASVLDTAERARDAEERRRQTFENELAQLLGDEIAAKRALVESAEEIAKLRLAEIETERQSYNDNLASLVAQRKLTEDEAAQLRGINDERAKYRAELVARNESIRKFRMEEAERERDARLDSVRRADAADVLRGQSDLARTLDERNDIERRLVDLQYQEEKAQNDRVIATYESLKAKKGILESELAEAKAAADAARIRNGSIDARKGGDLEGIGRNNPLDRYIDDISDTKTRVQEAVVRQLQEVNDGITDALADELGIKSQFVKDLFSIFLDEAIFKPLAESLRNKQSGGGGFLSTIFSIGASLFGGGGYTGDGAPGTAGGMDLRGFRAGGGRTNAGSTYRINENATPGNPEFFEADVSGRVYSLGQMNARASSASKGTVIQPIINVDARGAVMNDQFAKQILAQADQTAAGYAASMGKTVLKAVPSRLEQYQSDGI